MSSYPAQMRKRSVQERKRSPQIRRLACCGLLLFLGFALGGCQSAARDVYYDTMERFGRQKRHILNDRVAEGRESQRDAQEQFQTTYDRFKAVTGYSGGDLESVYGKLQKEYDRSEKRAAEVRTRIRSIEQVARDLFAEWSEELETIGSQKLRVSSQAKRDATERRYEELIATMRTAAARMDPVLAAFRDQVLFLKHNLNAAAIASLEDNAVSIERDVEVLIREIEVSIRQADAFLETAE